MSELLFLCLFFITIVIFVVCCTFIQGEKENQQILSFYEKLKTGNILVMYINGFPRYFTYKNPVLDTTNQQIKLFPEYTEVKNFDIGRLETADYLKISFQDIVFKEEQYKVLKYNPEIRDVSLI